VKETTARQLAKSEKRKKLKTKENIAEKRKTTEETE